MPQVCRLVFAMNDRFKMIDTFACNEWPPTQAAFSFKKGKLLDGGKDTLKPWSVVESTPVIQLGGGRFALLRVVVHSLCAR